MRFRRKRESGRHRGEPKRHYGPVLVFLATAGFVGSAIVTAFIVQGNPNPPLAPGEYHPSSPAVIPQPVVFPPVKQDRTYTVAAGDRLWTIAYRECGDGRKWEALQHANGINPWWLHPGQVLKLPAPACA